MSKATGLVTFVMGAVVGSVVTWQCVKKKYEQIAQEEIDSVKDIFSKRETDAKIKDKVSDSQPEKEGYVNYSGVGGKNEEQNAMDNKPYVISPEEFGEFEEYEKISLSYYADRVLADENDELVEDVEGVIGIESLTHFGEYEDDSVFVRNDRLKCDYEILMDQRTYSEVLKTKLHRTEV